MYRQLSSTHLSVYDTTTIQTDIKMSIAALVQCRQFHNIKLHGKRLTLSLSGDDVLLLVPVEVGYPLDGQIV
jgi:hypothetical protein